MKHTVHLAQRAGFFVIDINFDRMGRGGGGGFTSWFNILTRLFMVGWCTMVESLQFETVSISMAQIYDVNAFCFPNFLISSFTSSIAPVYRGGKAGGTSGHQVDAQGAATAHQSHAPASEVGAPIHVSNLVHHLHRQR
jgi:hypothetical protein